MILFEPNVSGKSFILIISFCFIPVWKNLFKSIGFWLANVIDLKYLLRSSFSFVGATEAIFPKLACCWFWFCWINFSMSSILILPGSDVFVFAKGFDILEGIWKYLFKSSFSCCCWGCIWDGCWGIFISSLLDSGIEAICLVLATWLIKFIGAALLWEIKVGLSTCCKFEIFDIFDCMASFLIGSPGFWTDCSVWLIFSKSLISPLLIIWLFKLYCANSSWLYWSKFKFKFCILLSYSPIWLYWTGLDSLIGTSYAPPIFGELSCSYNFWFEMSCWAYSSFWINSVSWG